MLNLKSFSSDLARAADDLSNAVARRSLWLTLAIWDVRRSYRRSVLGPFWHTISTAVFVGGIGFLYGGLMQEPLDRYLPHVACGYILWLFILNTTTSGTQLFIQEGEILKQIAIGSISLLLKMILRQILIAAHNAVVAIGVLLALEQWPGFGMMWAGPGLALLVFNLTWMALALGILSARYRDIPPIVASTMQIIFFLTPVIWFPERLPTHLALLEWNPFQNLIDIVREPLLSSTFPTFAFAYCCCLGLIGFVFTTWLYMRTRTRVVYWI